MREGRLFALVLLLAAAGPASAGPGDPELLPGFSRNAPAPRRAQPKPEPKTAPAPESSPDLLLPEVARRPRGRSLLVPEELPARPRLVLRSRAWLTSGSLNTRSTFQVPPDQITPRGLTVHLGETQQHSASGLLLLYGAEVAPLPWLSLAAEYGDSSQGGSFRDRYWVDAKDAYPLTYIPNGATWWHPDHEDDLIAGAALRTRRDWIAGTLYLRAWDGYIPGTDYYKLRHSLDFGLGYQRYRQYSRMTGLAIIGNSRKYYQPLLPLGAVNGYDSSYEGTFSGPHLALRDEVSGYGFSLEGLCMYSPFMSYRGVGYDNTLGTLGSLAAMQQGTLLRVASPNYKDSASAAAIHFAITGGWDWRWLRLEAGYQRFYFFSKTGKRTFYDIDGSASQTDLDFANADLGGVFGGASLRF